MTQFIEKAGLSPQQASILNLLTANQRGSAFSFLRKFYAVLYHPDHATGSSATMAEINGAIDILTKNYDTSYEEYLNGDHSYQSEYIERLKAETTHLRQVLQKERIEIQKLRLQVAAPASRPRRPEYQNIDYRKEAQAIQAKHTILFHEFTAWRLKANRGRGELIHQVRQILDSWPGFEVGLELECKQGSKKPVPPMPTIVTVNKAGDLISKISASAPPSNIGRLIGFVKTSNAAPRRSLETPLGMAAFMKILPQLVRIPVPGMRAVSIWHTHHGSGLSMRLTNLILAVNGTVKTTIPDTNGGQGNGPLRSDKKTGKPGIPRVSHTAGIQ